MARVIGTATVQIKADTSQFRSAVNGLGSGLTSGFGKLKGLIAGIGLGHLAAEAIRFGAEYRIQLDNAKAAVDGLTDSTGEANALMHDMVQFAIATPFDLPGVQNATTRLLAFGEGFGVTSTNVVQYIRTIGNAAASTGKGADAMNNVITVMGKISGQGRVMTRDLNPLTANFPSLHPWEILSEMTGKSVQELRRLSVLPGGLSGVVDATEFINELVDAMEELPGASADWEGLAKATGKTVDQLKAMGEEELMAVFRQFPTMADAMSRKMFTLGGTMEVFKDTMGVALADGLLPFFATMQEVMMDPAIQNALTGLAETFGALAGMIAEQLAPVLPSLINSFQRILVALMPAAPAIANIAMMFALMLVAMTPLIEQLAKLATTITNWLMTLDPTLLGYITAALLTFYLVGFGWIPLLIAAVVLLAMFIAQNWQYIADAAKEYTAMIVQAWQWLFDNVIDPVRDFVMMIVDFFVMLYDTLVGNSIIPDLVNGITEWFNKLFGWLIDIVTGIVNFIRDHWKLLISIFLGPLGIVLALVITHFNTIKSFIGAAINAIKSVLTSVWNAIKSVISTVLSGISSVVTTVWNGIKTTVTTVVNAIKSTVTTVWNAIKSVATTVWNGIKTAITTPIEAAKSLISGIVDTIKGYLDFGGLVSTVTGIWNSVKEAILAPLRTAASLVSGIISQITGPVETAVSGIKSATGWIPGTPWAKGGVYWGSAPLPSIIHGPEAMIPLNNPMRAMQVMHEAGLDRLIGKMGEGRSGFSGPLVSMPGAVIQDATDADLVAQRTLVAMQAAMVA
jgi:tape measure domain-containing protein